MSKQEQYKPDFKAKVALGPLKGEQTMPPKLVSRFGVRPMMIHQWKRALLEGKRFRITLFSVARWRNGLGSIVGLAGHPPR